jgi:hypothetical protein
MRLFIRQSVVIYLLWSSHVGDECVVICSVFLICTLRKANDVTFTNRLVNIGVFSALHGFWAMELSGVQHVQYYYQQLFRSLV